MSGSGQLRESNLRLRFPGAKRRERDTLGFLRQPMVRWFSPPILARAAIEVAVSGAFGKFADKRESQVWDQRAYDFSGRSELWIDYLSDTADGFETTYTMASLLSAAELEVGARRPLPRGDVVVLGGDQVYPAADPEAYKDRFLAPFAAAFPSAGEAVQPRMFAVPGNHDWYDGLTSFLRIFGQRGTIGGWRKRQLRSYFALKLPHRWWLWAIDIQLDTYLDKRQLDYFVQVSRDLCAGDKVILATAKPSWVKAKPGRLEPPSWEYLAFFEREMIRDKGGDVVLTLTGDIHHYARYEPLRGDGGAAAPTRITAGGGGAYLSGTHTLPRDLELTTAPGGEVAAYRRAATYPGRGTSKRLAVGVLRLPWTNPGFGGLMAAIYGLVAAAAWAALGTDAQGLAAAITAVDLPRFVVRAADATTIPLAGLLCALLVVYADFSEVRPAALRWVSKLLAGLFHAALHLAVVASALYLVASVLGVPVGGALFVPLALVVVAGAGYLVGSFIFAVVLLAIHGAFGWRSPKHANEVFASQGIVDHKNFLRLHVGQDGRLTVYPLAVDKVCRRWRFAGKSPQDPWFEPVGAGPRARLIEGPLRFPPPLTGRRPRR